VISTQAKVSHFLTRSVFKHRQHLSFQVMKEAEGSEEETDFLEEEGERKVKDKD
jgi:hypothetical protein